MYAQMVGHLTDTDTLHPLEPDIYGEWFLMNPPFKGAKTQCLTLQQAAWQRPEADIPYVLYRTIRDFPQYTSVVMGFITAVLNTAPVNKVALTLFGQTGDASEATMREAIGKLEGLDTSQPVVMEHYAKALYNLTVGTPEVTRREAIGKLEGLDTSQPVVMDPYAKALMSLTDGMPEATMREAIGKLERLDTSQPVVMDPYAKALMNLTVGTPEATKREAIGKLKGLDTSQPVVMEPYANALYNLTAGDASEATMREAIGKLEGLDTSQPVVMEHYAKALMNLTVDTPEATMREAIGKLEELYQQSTTWIRPLALLAQSVKTAVCDHLDALLTLNPTAQWITAFQQALKNTP
jgi:hypothetical protein